MRGRIAGLASAVPLAGQLPGVLQDDEFLGRFLRAIDDAFAPVITTLDSLPAYVDPQLSPTDFLAFVGEWVGVELDDHWTVEEARSAVAGATAMHRRRGTARGIADAVRLTLGGDVAVEVTESGAVAWSQSANTALPGAPAQEITVTVTAADPARVPTAAARAAVIAAAPAQVFATVEVVGGATGDRPTGQPSGRHS